jgi:hypothetical protein
MSASGDTGPDSGAAPAVGEFIKESGFPKWGKLLRTFFGVSVLAWFSGVVSVVLNLADIPIELLSGLAEFLGQVVFVVSRFPVLFIRSGFQEALPFVQEAGIAGYIAAVSIVLVTLYVVAWVVNLVE